MPKPKPSLRRASAPDLGEILRRVVAFRDARDWRQFHKANHLAAVISIEAAELQENFLWKSPEQVTNLLAKAEGRKALTEEIADILIFSLLFCHGLGVDPATAIQQRLQTNAAKSPVGKTRGSAAKYTEL